MPQKNVAHMLGFGRPQSQRNTAEMSQVLAALDRSMAIIDFKLDGTILNANKNFLSVMGYDLSEVQGKHHSMFVDPEYGKTQEYQDFWQALKGGAVLLGAI